MDGGEVEMLAPRTIARLLDVSRQKVYALIDSGDLKAVRIGGNVRVRRADFDAYVAANAKAVA